MPPLDPAPGKTYWRSLDDRADSPAYRAFVEREFPTYLDEQATETSRRRFLQIMGASAALAGLTACRWPAEEIVPFAHRPEGYVPGEPVRFATAHEQGGAALGLVLTSYDGRPVKAEGNPHHPASLGATDAHAQALLLEMYDPDRSRDVVRREGGGTWADAEAWLSAEAARLRGTGGEGLRVLSEISSSPTLERLRARMAEVFPRAQWHVWDPFNQDQVRAGAAIAYGRPLRTHLRLDLARVIVSFDADLFLNHPAAVRLSRDWASHRRAEDGTMNRLWVVEAGHSTTGAVADHRVPVRPSEIPRLVAALAHELGVAPSPEGPDPRVVPMARDLAAHRGTSVVAVGAEQPPQVHALVHLINERLGNAGVTVVHTAEPAGPGCLESLQALTADMKAGRVQTLLVLGGNPVLDAPADLGFAEALARVPGSVRLGLYRDETSAACAWHLPRAHVLESWGDARAWDGTLSVIQPLIDPLWAGRTPIELVAFLVGEQPAKGRELVRATLAAMGADDRAWRRILHDGVAPDSAWPVEPPGPASTAWLAAWTRPADRNDLEVAFRRDGKIGDGRWANNGWLQELPEPMTKVTWDNPALVAPETASRLGLSRGDVVRLDVGGRWVELPVFVQPGQPADTVTVHVGYGRTGAGRVGNGVGVDVYPLRSSQALHHASARLEKTGRRYELATTQDHHAIGTIGGEGEQKRLPTLVREMTLASFAGAPGSGHGEGHGSTHAAGHAPAPGPVGDPLRHAPETEMFRELEYDGHKWAMSIDLSACVGCAACVVACQAENNIPVVGKEEVARGREMHWLRIDRYFRGQEAAPSVSFAPVPCMHCENAPCEQVCPVGATMHDEDGLNVQVYNRCVGTRYCSNNCPYKVRRFNFFNNHLDLVPVQKMLFNPEVTVRSRGVMEKCTYCTQRITAAKITARNEGRPIRDGEVVPACAQSCPTQAIVFGDLRDAGSRIAQLHRHRRSFAMVEEINTEPRTRYLAQLRNPAGGEEHPA